MSENKKYTIIVKKQRVEVSEAVYRAYHQEREAERYQRKLIYQNELSMEKFQEDGVNADYLIVRVQPDIVDRLIQQEQLQALRLALQLLSMEERSLIEELFFNEKSESQIAKSIGVNQSTVSRRLAKILAKLRNLMEM